ncbi:MAG: class I SAM-dependent RNA methyltransferase [Rickettsiales bacterium]|nr:class I SAM-dependent RNA methyltransferase [Rickettsiales bacterium]
MTSSQALNTSPCPYFVSCGGCDFLDLSEENYREIKQKNLGENLQTNNWIWVGPHSRRKINLQIGPKNQIGFFAKKSKNITEIENCFVAEKEISDLILPLKNFLKSQDQNLFTQISVTLFDNGLDLIFTAKKDLNFSQTQKLLGFGQEKNLNISCRVNNRVAPIFIKRKNQIFYPDFKIDLGPEIFIQATKKGLGSIVKIIRDFLEQNKNIKNIVDIYAGFGAYSFAVIDLAKSVFAFEGDEQMVKSINKNAALNDLAHKLRAEVCDLVASPIHKRDLAKFDLAIINPPRNGASPQVLEISKSTLKNVIYVSCNPESFARDSKILIDSGFRITSLTALDQFYSTKHLELITILQRN